MQPQMPAAQRPYVAFERRAVEKRRPLDHETEPGMLYVEEEDFVKITPPGSKDIFEKNAKEWLDSLAWKVEQKIESMENMLYFRQLYDYWKKGEELPLEGTPIKGWPVATKAEQLKCIQLHILTVEALATCNQEAIMRLGMGGQALRNRAEDWLKAKNETAPLVARLGAQQVSIEALQKAVQELQAENRVLRSMTKVDGGVHAAPLAMQPAEPNWDPPEEQNPNLVEDALNDGLNTVLAEKANRPSALLLDV